MIKPKSIIVLAYSFLLLFLNQKLVAQAQKSQFNQKEVTLTIDSISKKLIENYVFPEVSKQMAKMLGTNLKEGKYKSMVDHQALANQLTEDLRSVSKDKHLQVIYNPSIIARENARTDEDRANEEAEWIQTLIRHLERDNYGFREVKILEGNVGYLDIREFNDPQYGGATLTNAMQFLSNTEALIIDLRNNDGGHPGMVQLLASYFFSEPVHYANQYNRPKDELTQAWTLPYVPGKRLSDVKLYILTSSKTFSAAEAFSYFMKHLGRATIVGEKTSGGAHLTGSVIATDKFYVRIPQGRPTSTVTNSNWEGTGVIPAIEIGEEQALKTAYEKALKTLEDRR
ncbi:MAG: S41 family peptidase [Bacteroidota bacterium]